MQPVELAEGTSVKVIITANDSTQKVENPADMAQIALVNLAQLLSFPKTGILKFFGQPERRSAGEWIASPPELFRVVI